MQIKSFEMWRPVKIVDKTKRILSNGSTIPTWEAMERMIAKI